MTKTIFIIEDEESLAQSLSESLTKEGFIIEIAHNGTEAMKMLPVMRPDLILLDIILPEMSGIDFLRQIHKNGSEFADIPVIVLTNLYGDESNFEKLGLEVEGYFVKANTSLKELTHKIKETLEKAFELHKKQAE